VRRREFIALLPGAAASALPFAAHAQQPAMPAIGLLHRSSAATSAPQLVGFHAGLKEGGFVEGHNLAIEYRWAEDRADRVAAPRTNIRNCGSNPRTGA
jgi:putative ABC transport system substrate-binding protein